MMQMHQGDLYSLDEDLIEKFVAGVLDLTAQAFCARWRRAVDILWRQAVRQHQESLTQSERAARRLRNLQRIVREAHPDYHKIELEPRRRVYRRRV